jgi:hypothetical protein
MFTKLVCAKRIQAICFTAFFTVMLSASASICLAQSAQRQSDQVMLTPGTVIPVTTNTELSSNGSSKGDTFTATIDNSKQAYDNIMRGATVEGVVAEATPQQGDQPGILDLTFTRIRLSDGRSYPISGTLTSLDAKNLSISSAGILKAKNTSKDHRLTYAGIGAGAGALISLLGGGKLKIEDILLGGLAGYGVGSIAKSPVQVHDVDLKPGTPMGVLLGNRVEYYPQSQQGGTSQGRYHRTYTSNGIKHYWYNGQEWTTNLSTGERSQVGNVPSPRQGKGRYYSYQGHPYYMNTDTGERTQLD